MARVRFRFPSHKFTAFGAALAILSVALAPCAHAQRGGSYTLTGTPPTTPSSGFPGMFDANVAERGAFVLDLPSLSADYGITENVTIGTNGWFVLPLAFGAPALSLKTRYRFLASPEFASVFTLHGGYFTNRAGASRDANLDVYIAGVSNNTTYYFSERSYANLFLYFLKVGVNQDKTDGKEYSNAALSTLLFGGSYQYWLTGWFGPQALAGLSVYQNTSIDSSTIAINANLGGVGGLGPGIAFVRLTPEFRLGRWLLSPALIGYVDTSSGKAGALPWINGTVKW